MSQKTALQQAIELIKKKNKYENVHVSAGLNMMEAAYVQGKMEWIRNQYTDNKCTTASDYYATTYPSAAPVIEQSNFKTVNEVMTFSDEDFVKSVYNDAECLPVDYGNDDTLWCITTPKRIIVSHCKTQKAAWSSAADRIINKKK